MQKDLQKSVQQLAPVQKIMQGIKENGTDAESGTEEFAECDAEVVQNFVQ